MIFKKTIHILFASVMLASGFTAQAKNNIDKYHEEIVEMSVEENLMTPEVPKKQLTAIKNRQLSVARYLKKQGLNVEMARDGLAVVFSLPSDGIFAPNDTVVTAAGAKLLETVGHYLKTPDFYKMLVVAHSDNTGSEEYLNTLTTSRADAVVRTFEDKGLQVAGVVPYGMGMDEPIEPNSSRRGRAANRRIEFYFIPGPQMISSAKSGKL